MFCMTHVLNSELDSIVYIKIYVHNPVKYVDIYGTWITSRKVNFLMMCLKHFSDDVSKIMRIMM